MSPAALRALSVVNGWETVRYELLQTRLCDLGVDIEGSNLEDHIDRLNRELESKIGAKISDLSKVPKDSEITVVDSSKLDQLRQSNPNLWNTASMSEIAKALGADYVLDVTLSSLSFYDRQTGREICRGHATVSVAVYDAVGNGKPLTQYGHSSDAPLRDTSSLPVNLYRNTYMERLATEIALKHVKHKAEIERELSKQ